MSEPAIALSPLLGEGLYEAILIWHGRPVLLEAHLGRLLASAQALGMWAPERELLEQQARQRAAEVAGTGRLRVALLRPLGESWRLLVEAAAEVPRTDPVTMATVPAELSPPLALARHKTTNRMPYLLARAHAQGQGAQEALLTEASGAVTEASSANVFAVVAGRLITPGLEGPLLPGVTRAALIALAGELGLAVEQRRVARQELEGASEMFCSSAIAGVRPVAALNGQEMPAPGPVTQRLAEAYVTRYLG